MKIFIIGPGGVGKTTCGKILAKTLDCKFIDLDQKFCYQIKNIRKYILDKGYESYCRANSTLFYKLLQESPKNFVFSLSSGFLVHENLNDLTRKHKQTLKNLGISILLLPSKSLKKSVDVVVKRQISRGFGLNKEKEKEKFSKRFYKYRKHGDIKIFSYDNPNKIVKLMEKKIFNL